MSNQTYTYRLIRSREKDFTKAVEKAEEDGFEIHTCGCAYVNAYEPKWWAIMRKQKIDREPCHFSMPSPEPKTQGKKLSDWWSTSS